MPEGGKLPQATKHDSIRGLIMNFKLKSFFEKQQLPNMFLH